MRKSNKRKNNTSLVHIISNIIYIIAIILFIWFALSYIEIIIKNTNPDPVYSDWNLLVHTCKIK